MNYDEFVGQVQNRARLESRGKAERAIEATLSTLAERLAGGESEHLVAQLPEDIARRIDTDAGPGESFSFDDFKAKVAEREGVDEGDAVFHSRAVIEVWQEAVSPQQVKHVKSQLTNDYLPWFDSGSQGELRG